MSETRPSPVFTTGKRRTGPRDGESYPEQHYVWLRAEQEAYHRDPRYPLAVEVGHQEAENLKPPTITLRLPDVIRASEWPHLVALVKLAMEEYHATYGIPAGGST